MRPAILDPELYELAYATMRDYAPRIPFRRKVFEAGGHERTLARFVSNRYAPSPVDARTIFKSSTRPNRWTGPRPGGAPGGAGLYLAQARPADDEFSPPLRAELQVYQQIELRERKLEAARKRESPIPYRPSSWLQRQQAITQFRLYYFRVVQPLALFDLSRVAGYDFIRQLEISALGEKIDALQRGPRSFGYLSLREAMLANANHSVARAFGHALYDLQRELKIDGIFVESARQWEIGPALDDCNVILFGRDGTVIDALRVVEEECFYHCGKQHHVKTYRYDDDERRIEERDKKRNFPW